MSRRSSAAALDESARTRIRSGATPCPASHAKRAASVAVLPVPAPPRIASGPRGWETASVTAGTDLGYARMANPSTALEADWLGASRRATQALGTLLADRPTTEERAEETGDRGEGGDQPLVIDARAEDAVFDQLDAVPRFPVIAARSIAALDEMRNVPSVYGP